MARFYGFIGFVEYADQGNDIWKETVTERAYAGDLIRKTNRFVQGTSVNDNLTISNQVSVVADPYINDHFPSIRYVKWKGCNWKVESVEDQFPRVILTLGGVYNGEQS